MAGRLQALTAVPAKVGLATLVLTLGAGVSLTVPMDASTGASTVCGRERWPVKTLLDKAARRINYAPRWTTVERLRALPRPKSNIRATTPRLRPYEFRTYRLSAIVMAARRLPKSRDTLLVIRGATPGATMLVAFPNTHECLEINVGPKGGDIHNASDEFNADCGPSIPSDSWQRLRGLATIAGVAYFDVRHSNKAHGEAPSGIRIHPALSFFSSGCRQVFGQR
jgi:hypothetical protein